MRRCYFASGSTINVYYNPRAASAAMGVDLLSYIACCPTLHGCRATVARAPGRATSSIHGGDDAQGPLLGRQAAGEAWAAGCPTALEQPPCHAELGRHQQFPVVVRHCQLTAEGGIPVGSEKQAVHWVEPLGVAPARSTWLHLSSVASAERVFHMVFLDRWRVQLIADVGRE